MGRIGLWNGKKEEEWARRGTNGGNSTPAAKSWFRPCWRFASYKLASLLYVVMNGENVIDSSEQLPPETQVVVSGRLLSVRKQLT